jgi:hydrogenase/urease accessory protein HupE
MNGLRGLFLSLCLALLSAASLRAHDPGLSALALRVEDSALTMTLTLARADVETVVPLDADREGRGAASVFEKARPALERVAKTAVGVVLNGDELEPKLVSVRLDASDALHVQLSVPLTADADLEVRSALLASLPRGHRQYVALRDAHDRLVKEKMLDANDAVFSARLTGASRSPAPPLSLGQFLWLGIEHIATGYDHLAFLLGLLIVGGEGRGRRLRAVAGIITAFTVAHSITLALATLDVVRLQPSVVEPLIAASIVYVGLENLLQRDFDHRSAVAFVFGLIHGCGFASALRELGIGRDGGDVVLPLLSFNLGVELGQLALAALILPLIWKLKRRELFLTRCVPACSTLIALAGGWWLAQRLLPLIQRVSESVSR